MIGGGNMPYNKYYKEVFDITENNELQQLDLSYAEIIIEAQASADSQADTEIEFLEYINRLHSKV